MIFVDQPLEMWLLPPAPGKCQVCGSEHEPELPHNAQSLYYQTAFNMEHGRAPTWQDAWAHCSPEMQAMWRTELIKLGVDIDAGDIIPKRARGTAGHD